MEEDLFHSPISSLKKSKEKELIESRLKEAIDIAKDRMDYESAHNEELLRALAVVAEFIKKKKRVCYGGTAMNEILPESKRFYNPDLDLPDYDFYTPDLEGDVVALVAELKREGFKDVYHKVGMHDGTKKILVNFVAVADVSSINPELFKIFYKRSIRRDGVHYTDPNVLRMMMYLELSRPKGDVTRWEKVFERLQLINTIFPVRGGSDGGKGREPRGSTEPAPIPMSVRQVLLDFCITSQRVLCSGPLETLYERGITKGDARFEVRSGGPVILLSPEPREDAKLLRKALKSEETQFFLHKSRGEIVPERIEIRVGEIPVCLLVREEACHAYNQLPMGDGRMIRIASLEMLVTLYLSMEIFTTRAADFLGSGAMGRVRNFIRLAEKNYVAKKSQFPPFSLSCSGHQVGFISLLRQKVLRIQREKDAMKGVAKGQRRGRTRKAKKERAGTRSSSKGV